MEYFAGLDVSLDTVNVCIVNAAGDILLEKKIAAEPAAIVHLLKSFGSPNTSPLAFTRQLRQTRDQCALMVQARPRGRSWR